MTEPTGAAPTDPEVPEPFEPPTAAPTAGGVTDATGRVLEPTTLPPAETVAEATRRARPATPAAPAAPAEEA